MIILTFLFAIFAAASARLPLNLTQCGSTTEILDRSGKVVKYTCELSFPLTYAQSVAACAARGMDLVWAEDMFVYNSIMNIFRKNSGPPACTSTWPNGCGLWFNGEKLANGTYYATIDGVKKPMDVSFYNFVRNTATGYDNPGNCLATKNQNGFGQTSWNCNQTYGPICEYKNTYVPSTARAKLDLSKCTTTADILGSDGKVAKSVCEVYHLPTPNYAENIKLCTLLGMDLVYAEDAFIYGEIMKYINSTFFVHPCTSKWNTGCGLWFNGEKTSDGTWFATINGEKRLLDVSFYSFVSNLDSGYSDPGNCLATKNQDAFGQTAWNCNQPYGPICEYNNNYKPPCITSNQGTRYFNLAKCNSVATIRDDCGNVVKGICEIKGPFNYDDAVQACRNNGMDLIVAETPKIFSELQKYLGGRFRASPSNCSLWLGGKVSNNLWYRVKDWNTRAMDPFPYTGAWAISQKPGSCLATLGVSKTARHDCTQLLDAICEFDSKIQP